jgi:hypothetical protein
MISAQQIRSTYRIIGPHIRRTPIIEVDGADLGLDTAPLILKLESLQHAGSFKARGAFTNLLTRSVPAAGVVAASGGNHGAAVARDESRWWASNRNSRPRSLARSRPAGRLMPRPAASLPTLWRRAGWASGYSPSFSAT